MLFIITNGFKKVQLKKLELSGISTYFTKVFISEEVKSHKPAKEIFEYSVKSANAKKSRSLMIGNDFEVDVAGALNFGIDAVWFNATSFSSNEKFPSPFPKLYHVKNLIELMEIL